ncbi:MAG TPA: lipopolysaccharide transport periplasmic protein LptA [Gammaproteobacteria bacterium]
MNRANPEHWLLLLCLCLPLPSWALSSDREQPMHIESDQAELDDQKGVSIYIGNVRVTQGTLVLTGEHMTVYQDGANLDRVILLGKPATYRQRPDGKDEDMRAEALRMEYFANPERLILLEEAVAWQGKDSFRSDRIVYEVAQDRVLGGDPEGGQRVHIILQPRPNTEGQASE